MNDVLSNLFGTDINVWVIAKILYVAAFVVYFIFSLVVLRQIYLMSYTLDDVFNPIILVIGSFLTFLAFLGLVGAIVLL